MFGKLFRRPAAPVAPAVVRLPVSPASVPANYGDPSGKAKSSWETERMHPRIVLLEYAMAFVGEPYRWGGDDPINGFDCSGLVIELLKSQGVVERDFDTTAAGLATKFPKVDEPNFGTLALFGPLEKPTHVGFCLSPELMLEAGGGGSKTLTREDAAQQNAFVRVRPVKSRADFTSFHQPTYPFWKG